MLRVPACHLVTRAARALEETVRMNTDFTRPLDHCHLSMADQGLLEHKVIVDPAIYLLYYRSRELRVRALSLEPLQS